MGVNAESRYAVYLLPPYTIAQPLVQIHTMLRKQFGFVAADRFQVHATIEGFFKLWVGSLEPLVAGSDGVFAAQRPFPIQISGFRNNESGIGLNINLLDGQPNQALHDFRERVVAVCMFTL